MKVLVTGATGFLGRALVSRLLKDGHWVTATAREYRPPQRHKAPDWKRLDLSDPRSDWSELLAGVELIYHLAWSKVPSEADRELAEDARVNIVGSLRLIEALRSMARPRRIVFASSGGTVYGVLSQIPATEDHPLRPISAHGISKRAVEAYLEVISRERGLQAVSLRMGNVYGPAQGLARPFGAVAHFAHLAVAGKPIRIFGDGSVTRDYLYIDDAVDALIRAGFGSGQGNYNIGTGIGHALSDIVAIIATHLGRDLPLERHPSRAFDVPVSILDASRARQTFGWEARVTLEDGIVKTLHYLQGLGPGS
jgi:UDP-glucose 4-epimerase